MDNNLWKTLFTTDFDNSQYLYHYTNIDKAIKIINSDSLRFSSINSTNDTSEAKLKIRFEHTKFDSIQSEEDFETKTESILKFFCDKHPLIRLLCFSMDVKLKKTEIKKINDNLIREKDRYYNVLGRGFALPRMWAQYASDNTGVCFIIDREKLLKQINKKIEYHSEGPVKYRNFFVNYIIKNEAIDLLYDKITLSTNSNLTMAKLFSKDSDFIKYNYFEKLSDWESENEYRIIALTDNDSLLHIENFHSYLKGVVFGENIDPAYENVIKILLNDCCEIKKISFENNVCRIV